MPEPQLIDKLQKVNQLLEKLIEISKLQQELSVTKDWSMLVDTFEKREKLVAEVCNVWNGINGRLEAIENDNAAVSELKLVVRNLIEEFIKNDQYVQALLNYQMENIIIELCRRKNVQVVVEQYKQTDRITGVISRTFKNGPRYFDGNF